MAVSEGMRDLLLEALAPLGPVRIKRMFGGGGVFLDGVMLGLIVDDTLYFKTDDGNRHAFESVGMEPFVYSRQGKSVALSYWRAPEHLLDDPMEMLAFARAAFAAARRAANAKPSKATPLRATPPKPMTPRVRTMRSKTTRS